MEISKFTKVVDINKKLKDAINDELIKIPRDREIEWDKLLNHLVDLGTESVNIYTVPTSVLLKCLKEIKYDGAI